MSVYGPRPTARTLKAHVYADGIVNGQATLVDAGTININVIPEAPYIAPNYYIVGGSKGWDSSKGQQFSHSSLDVYEDPIFTDAKVVLSLYNEQLDARLSDNVTEKVATGGLAAEDVAVLAEPTGINLAKLAIQYADGVIAGVPALDPRLMEAVRQQGLPVLPYVPVSKEGGPYVQAYNQFYDDLLKD